jgi:predicted CXXCH cytochrome family protein
MPETEFDKSGAGLPVPICAGMDDPAGKRPGTGRRIIPALAVLVLCAAFPGGWTPVSATEQDGRKQQEETEDVAHPPLAGQPCVDCHKQSVSRNGTCLLTGERMCVLCHEIPEAGGRADLADPSAALCFKCHAEETFRGDFAHGPFAAGACLTCHSPHGGDASAMVRIDGRQLCLACHKDMEPDFANARFRHQATASGCTGCHSPHASGYRYQILKPVPDVCAKCHEDTFKKFETAAVTHSPVKEDPACLNCHDPHASGNERLLLGEDMALCLGCHNDAVKAGQYELAPMGRLLAENPLRHGPLQFGECSACHNAHGSPYFRLLTDAYPGRLYAPYFESSYALCFRCHEPALAGEERTESRTGFRDGDRNLHFVHVNKSSMGRTCGLCHDAHASTQPKHVRESVPFGTWNLPVKFKQTENGGSCEPGCHAAQSYDRLAAQSGRP